MNVPDTDNDKLVGSEPFFYGWFIVGILFFISILDGEFSTAFYALYLFLGVGLGGIGPTTIGKIISQWFVAKRGRAMGIALVGAGGLVLVPLAGLLIAEFHWREADFI
jgi:MFS family permease